MVKTPYFFSSLKASLIIVSLLFLWACAESPSYIKLQGAIFGTTFHITYKDPSTGVSKDIILADVQARLSELDLIFSTYKQESEISRFNRLAVINTVEVSHVQQSENALLVSNDFIQVLDLSRHIYQSSNHAFNPAIGPLVELWGFGPKVTIKNFTSIPDKAAIRQALRLIDFNAVQNQGQLVYKSSAVKIDFSAVAKGYAVDQIAQLLQDFNIEHFMVEIGGELVTAGDNASATAWKIGVEKPDALVGTVSDVLALHTAALATSGDYRNFFELDGRRYSHTIDPRTGYPVAHHLASVTVITDSSAAADAWATALMVLGEEEGLALAEKFKLSSLFIIRQADEYTAIQVANFSQYMQ